MPGRGRTLLLVEDERELRTLYRSVFTAVGYQVRESEDGLDALRRLDTEIPDVIVLDLGLPGVDGYDVLRELASRPETTNIPVVVVTGSTANLDSINAACIVRKPVTPEQLVIAVGRCLNF